MAKTPKILLIITIPFIIAMSWGFVRDRFRPESHLPIYGQVTGTYKFTDQDGKEFDTKSMMGKVWLVHFFFTSCHGPCPIMTAQISGILSTIPKLNVLSVSTDPETDTSDVLKAYSAKLKTDTSHWTMAFGKMEIVKSFGQDILKLPVGETPDAHSSRIVLLDRQGMIRGWYDSQEPKTREQLITDIQSL